MFGSKAVGLGDAARQGLPVPPGVALSGDLVEAIASGDAHAIEKVTDIWTFRRDTRSSNPNWQLVATRSPN